MENCKKIVANMVNSEKFANFIESAKINFKKSYKINNIKNDDFFLFSKNLAKEIFFDDINSAKKDINNVNVGISSIDFPERQKVENSDALFWDVLIGQSITANIFEQTSDTLNNLTYSVFASSNEKSDLLESFGLRKYLPTEKKIKFHTDGLVNDSKVSIPKYLMLQNLLIRYKKPGKIYWIPFAEWPDKKHYMNSIGIGEFYNFKLSPSIHENEHGALESAFKEYVKAPVFFNNPEHDFPVFFNGEILNSDKHKKFDMSIFSKMRNSLESNKLIYSIEQKERRLVFISNTRGVHARDIFLEPTGKNKYSRIMLRSISSESINF